MTENEPTMGTGVDPSKLSDRDVLWLIYGIQQGIHSQMSRQNTLLRLTVLLLGVIAAGRAALDAVNLGA